MAESSALTESLSYGSDRLGGAVRPVAVPVASRAWRVAVCALIAVIWLIPIKSYRLPVSLPFNLEPYRLVIIALLFALVLSVVIRGRRLDAGGHGLPVILLAAAGVASLLAARQTIDQAGLQTQAIKSLTYLLSFVVAFILVASVIGALEDIVAVVAVIVVGAVVVAVSALVESRTHYNLFDHLQSWIPFLDRNRGATTFSRAGRLRVHGSAQHPIALGVALAMCVPLAVYLWQQARSKLWSWVWLGGGIVIATGAAVTQSRTVPLMLVGMIATALWLRPSGVARRWPLLLVAVAFIHFASPHTLGNLYNSFTPSGGLLSQQEARSGYGGSGRIADIRPGVKLWEHEPIFGRGSGTNPTRGGAAGPQADSTETRTSIIFDDQYMSSLVELGIVGFIAVVWLVVGVVLKLGTAARRTQGRVGDLLVACSAACAGFAVAMATFDAFSFVQVTLLFFVIAALGLQARRIALARGAEAGAAGAEGSAPTW